MIKKAKFLAKSKVSFGLTALMSASIGFSSLMLCTTANSAGMGVGQTSAQRGQEVAFTRKLGNCLACHVVAGGISGGNIAPPLVSMKLRFPDKALLKAQVYDARIKNPDTSMLPFGAHGILTKAQLDDVIEFLYTL